MLPNLTKYASGTQGNNIASGTNVAVITDPLPGRWRITGTVRHSVADGCRLLVGGTTILANICSSAGATESFGPVLVDINNNTDDIIVQLATATGASDTASANIYAERLF